VSTVATRSDQRVELTLRSFVPLREYHARLVTLPRKAAPGIARRHAASSPERRDLDLARVWGGCVGFGVWVGGGVGGCP